MGGSTHAVVVESLIMAAFVTVAVLALKFSPSLIVAGLAARGVIDVLRAAVDRNRRLRAEVRYLLRRRA
jgi:hypothetical protein